jgi:hypothetical protein
MHGGRSGDRSSDRPGGDADEVFGREGNDEIDVADLVDCDRSNNDKISPDPGDSLVGCEVFGDLGPVGGGWQPRRRAAGVASAIRITPKGERGS